MRYLWAIYLLICALVLSDCRTKDAIPFPPNIILIVADDLGYGDLSCYGAAKISTPNIDQLASEGIQFTNAYASSSLCSPSRYSIMTGRYSWRTELKEGVLPFFAEPMIEKERLTLGSLLKEQGYHTNYVGKWHLGLGWEIKKDSLKSKSDIHTLVPNSWDVSSQEYIDFSAGIKDGPLDRGFDYFFGISGSVNMLPYVYIENDSIVEFPRNFEKHTTFKDQYHLSSPDWDPKMVNQVLTQNAVKTIRNHFSEDGASPLFLYFAASAIHQACLPTFTKGKSRAGLRGDMVEELDWSVGEIIKSLKKEKAFENTLLIITSDNGPRPGDPVRTISKYKSSDSGSRAYYLDYFDEYSSELLNPNGNKMERAGWLTYDHEASGNHLGYKTDAWEGGLKVPFILHWPKKIEKIGENSSLICQTDLLATIADMTNVKVDKNDAEDSYSFYKKKPGGVEINSGRETLVISSGGSGAFVVRKGDWKYIEGSEPTEWTQTFYKEGPFVMEDQLYNLKEGKESQESNQYLENTKKRKELEQILEKVKKLGQREKI